MPSVEIHKPNAHHVYLYISLTIYVCACGEGVYIIFLCWCILCLATGNEFLKIRLKPVRWLVVRSAVLAVTISLEQEPVHIMKSVFPGARPLVWALNPACFCPVIVQQNILPLYERNTFTAEFSLEILK